MGYLEDISAKGASANPFFMMMGVEVRSMGEGKAVLSMKIQPGMKNGEGWLQGGLFVALADEAMALATYTLLSPDETIATVSESTSFLSGAKEGTLRAEATVIRRGRRVVFAEGNVFDDTTDRHLVRSSAVFAVSRLQA